MLLPAVFLTLLFAYLPILGLVSAFQDYKPWLGFFRSPWVGLDHFRYIFEREDGPQVIWNTLAISGMKIVAGLAAPLFFALLLNEVRQMWFKRTIQTIVYLPHFLSWVIFSGILLDILSVNGIVNKALVTLFHIKPIAFLSDGTLFRFIVVVSDVWKEFGFGTIVFLAALAGVNPALYEAAEIDGASRWRQTLYITVPSIMPIVVVLLTLSLGNVLNANFDQIFNMYSPIVYDKGDIIDTFVYRIGILNGELSFGAAMGMFKSVVGLILILSAYRAALKWANYRIF
ncbi:ABC transporter permease [Cohnella silvisoli]|uniref:ABC transporter permease subunit n=1 Tax=Cohnella silvisoli TaxID=2873699 RepID=A0ABV1L262_9BACL|nr:ABC transporter permease subunit [Cohnella silvisoli]MCD9025798.1 ABC transporter permease subunit [Cohnella silvisoli]